jgi:hypothetical protein
MGKLPLFFNHDYTKPIGTVEFSDDNFNKTLLNNDYVLGIGFQVYKEKIIDGKRYIEDGKIFEVSFCKKKT